MSERVAFDLDDVMLDFCGGVRHAVLTEYGVDVGPFTKWELRDVLDPVLGRSWWAWLKERDWLWPNFPALPGAIGCVEHLRHAGHYVELLTAKPKWAEFSTWKWLGKWRPPFQRVTIVCPEESKAEHSDARILIDDKLTNCIDWVESHPSRFALLFDRPHNAGFEPIAHDRIRRVLDFEAVITFVDTLDREGVV